jgi:glyoxylase-like metal-dependent hydrolase (beta-lactamase superfamily II)
VNSVRIGDIEVVPLSDGTFRLDGGAMFGVVPKTLWQRRVDVDADNRIPLGLTPLLVRTAGLNVLIDAGVGDKLSPKAHAIYCIDRTVSLDRTLAAAGLTPADIDRVVATHLHFDHAGGFTAVVDGRIRPRFPNARYLIRRGEWDDAMAPNERTRASYMPENYAPLAEAGVVDFIEADGEVLPGISVWRTGGHTMHHQVVRFDSGGRTGVFLADLVPTAAHLPEPWVMGYDLYPLDTLAAKKHWLRVATEREYVIFFEHDPVIRAGRITVADGTRHLEPLLASG